MSVANIIDEITGKIDPKYIPAIPATIPTLNQVLTTGNQTGGILIDAQGGNINCDALKCLSIEALTAPLFNTIAVDADLIVTQFGKLGFEDNALITCNELNTAKNVIETTNASTNLITTISGGNSSIVMGSDVTITALDNISLASSADIPISSSNVGAIVSIATLNTSVSLDEAIKAITIQATDINGVIELKANTNEATIKMYADPNGTSIGNIQIETTANTPGQVWNNLSLTGAGTALIAPFFSVTSTNPADAQQSLIATFDPTNYIQFSINDGVAGTGTTIDMFLNGEMALSATGVLNQTANSANMSITNDLTLSAAQTIISGGGVRFSKSDVNVNPILPTNYAISYTQVGAFTRTLPAITIDTIGQKYLITNAGTGTLTLTAFAGQFIHANGTATNTKVFTPNTTYLLTAIKSVNNITYGWSMVGSGAPPAMIVQAATGTLTLTPTMDRATYILTGTSATQNIATSLVGVPSGYCVYLRNGNNATGGIQDIAITGAATATLHAPTGTTNSSYVLLFWNGTALTAYR